MSIYIFLDVHCTFMCQKLYYNNSYENHCNKWHYDKNIKMESGCNICSYVDDLIHFFLDCENTKWFWTSFYKWWNNISEIKIVTNNIFGECTSFGYPVEEDIIQILNYFVLLLKYIIYTNELNGNNTLD